jgi:hypothetical protein
MTPIIRRTFSMMSLLLLVTSTTINAQETIFRVAPNVVNSNQIGIESTLGFLGLSLIQGQTSMLFLSVDGLYSQIVHLQREDGTVFSPEDIDFDEERAKNKLLGIMLDLDWPKVWHEIPRPVTIYCRWHSLLVRDLNNPSQ